MDLNPIKALLFWLFLLYKMLGNSGLNVFYTSVYQDLFICAAYAQNLVPPFLNMLYMIIIQNKIFKITKVCQCF